jgi:hypothetical protein
MIRHVENHRFSLISSIFDSISGITTFIFAFRQGFVVLWDKTGGKNRHDLMAFIGF